MWEFYLGQRNKAETEVNEDSLTTLNLEENLNLPTKHNSQAGLAYLEYHAPNRAFHNGIDLNHGKGDADCGNEVKATRNATVEHIHRNAATGKGYGKFIILKHEDGKYSRYAHLSNISVEKGAEIKTGQLIGHVGKTGTKFCHLHLEMFDERTAELQRNDEFSWRYHPADQTKEWVADHYMNPADHLTEDGKKVASGPKHSVYFTSYNPEVGQTDASPCIGASGKNQCELAKQGVRMLALSQDIVGRVDWKPYTYGDRVMLTGETDDPRCNGEFLVVDTMNKRYTMRGDLFFMSRSDNTSCTATVQKIS